MESIPAHGGRLVNRETTGVERETLLERAPAMPRINLRPREISDLEMIANGAFSPLEGFMCEDDYVAVRGNMHLASGLPWTIPVTLSTSEEFGSGCVEGSDIALFSDWIRRAPEKRSARRAGIGLLPSRLEIPSTGLTST